jgi:HD-GYP domain-containing protein (c-di-GMP phosphodiesterase class II)
MSYRHAIKPTFFKVRQETFCDVITENGRVIFAKDTTLSENNISRIQSTKETLFFNFESVNAWVTKIIAFDKDSLNEQESEITPQPPEEPTKEVELADDINFTLEQLFDHNNLTDVDNKTLSDPISRARSHRIHTTQLTHQERNPGYKSKILKYYEESCDRAETIYQNILSCSLTTTEPVAEIVENYIELLTSDMDIMLNLLNYQHPPYKDHIYSHAVKKMIMSLAIGTGANLSRKELAEVGLAAFLADIGLCSINNSMRNSKRKFDKGDNQNIRKHPIFAANIVRSLTGTYESTNSAIFQAHERENGTGYPKNKITADIHPFAKIIAIADVYCALISHRPHRKALPQFDGVKTVINMNKLGLLNQQLVNAFFIYTPLFPIGSVVKLTNGIYAKVVSSNPKSITHPVLRTLSNSIGKPVIERGYEVVNLLKSPSVRVSHSIDSIEFHAELNAGF